MHVDRQSQNEAERDEEDANSYAHCRAYPEHSKIMQSRPQPLPPCAAGARPAPTSHQRHGAAEDSR
jgi:hypothetical protein